MEPCKYLLPCGHCDKFDKYCPLQEQTKDKKENKRKILNEKVEPLNELPYVQLTIDDIINAQCKHDWFYDGIDSTGNIRYRCTKCGEIKTAFNSNLDVNLNMSDPCKNCPNHPNNGGSGICNCILGCPTITCNTTDINGNNITTTTTNTSGEIKKTTYNNTLEPNTVYLNGGLTVEEVGNV